MKRLLSRLEAALTAVAFAEEGEPDAARRILEEGERDAPRPGDERARGGRRR